MLKYFSFFILLYLISGNLCAYGQITNVDKKYNESYIDSIISNIIESKTSDSLKVKRLNSFAARQRYHKLTIRYIDEAKKIAKNDPVSLSDTYCALGNYYFFNSKIDSAEFYLNKANKLLSGQKAPFLKASILNSLSGIYRKHGNISLAIATLLESKSVLEKVDTLRLKPDLRKMLKGKKIVSNNSLANFYNQMKDYEKALSHYDAAYKSALSLQTPANAGVILSNKGNVLLNVGKYKRAYEVLQEAKELKIKGNAPKSSIANSNLSIGEALLKLKQYDKALASFNKAFTFYKENKLPIGLMEVKIQRGNLYNNLQKYHLAIKDCQEAKGLAIANKILEGQKNACLCLSNAYEKIKNYKKALQNYQLYQKAKDSIFNKNNIQKITQLEMQYSFNKEKELEKIKQKAIENENRIMVRNLIIGLLALILITILLYRLNYIRQKTNLQLKDKNQKISETLAVNKILLKETHHRVKNNLQIVLSLLNMQAKYLKDKKQKELIADTQNRIRSMSLIHQKLYKEKNITSIETKSYFSELILSLSHSYGIDLQKIKSNIQIESLQLDVDTAIPLGLILNELISNAFKYGVDEETGSFFFSFAKTKDEILEVIIADKGNGIPPDFDLQKSKSYGMKLIHTLSKKLNAIITFNNNNGLEVRVKIYKFKLAK